VKLARLPPRAWRTLYNVADALEPVAEGEVAVDLAPAVDAALRDAGEVRALRRILACLELEARARYAPMRGFSWLPRERRRALLASWERSSFASRRRAFARLRALLTSARDRAAQSLPGA
jgi:hypothetical protein